MSALRSATTSRWGRVALACVLQAALVPVAVWPQLSARLTGEVYLLEVAPVDPIDPFRGAYVALAYPALDVPPPAGVADGETAFVPLVRAAGSEVWTSGRPTSSAPADGPYLRCAAESGRLRCGIESLFAAQDEALRLERELADGAVARVRVDGRGHAAVQELLPGT